MMPKVYAIPQRNGLGWQFRCRYCDAWHFHGRGLGHRAAHCPKPTPYTATGYELVASSNVSVYKFTSFEYELAKWLLPIFPEQLDRDAQAMQWDFLNGRGDRKTVLRIREKLGFTTCERLNAQLDDLITRKGW